MANHQTIPTVVEDTAEALYVAFELSKAKWKLGFSDDSQRPAQMVTVDAPDVEAVVRQVLKAKQRLGLGEQAPVYTCYQR